MLEEWVAKRIQHPQVLAAYPHQRSKSYYFQTYEYLSGQTLNTWLHQQCQPIALETAIQITEQIIKGLQAFHRLDMLHQDIRPENIMLNAQLELKLIDFGATLVKGFPNHSRNMPRLWAPWPLWRRNIFARGRFPPVQTSFHWPWYCIMYLANSYPMAPNWRVVRRLNS